MPPLGRGRVVLAEVVDPQGRNPKQRPLVIVTATDEIQTGSPFVGVAISTTFPNPIPDDYVSLPFHPNGQVQTGLRKRCAAVCSWLVRLTHSDIKGDIGRVPDGQMREILDKVNRYVGGSGSTTKSDGNGEADE